VTTQTPFKWRHFQAEYNAPRKSDKNVLAFGTTITNNALWGRKRIRDKPYCSVPQVVIKEKEKREERNKHMPKILQARPACDDQEERWVRKIATSRHGPADWIIHAKMVARSWDGERYCQLTNNCRDNYGGFWMKVGHQPKFALKECPSRPSNEGSVGKTHQEIFLS
jgi:hypothetical protein